MVNKDFHKIIRDIKLADLNEINHKEAEPNILQETEQLKKNKTDKNQNSDFAPEKKEETKTEIKDEKEIEIEKEKEKEEPKNEIKIDTKEETKNKAKKKKNRHKKNKNEKKNKIFEIPKTNPYRDLFDFKEVSKLRFQDNSIFRVINNWEEKEWLQTTPPTKDIDELYPNQIFPKGEIQPYLK